MSFDELVQKLEAERDHKQHEISKQFRCEVTVLTHHKEKAHQSIATRYNARLKKLKEKREEFDELLAMSDTELRIHNSNDRLNTEGWSETEFNRTKTESQWASEQFGFIELTKNADFVALYLQAFRGVTRGALQKESNALYQRMYINGLLDVVPTKKDLDFIKEYASENPGGLVAFVEQRPGLKYLVIEEFCQGHRIDQFIAGLKIDPEKTLAHWEEQDSPFGELNLTQIVDLELLVEDQRIAGYVAEAIREGDYTINELEELKDAARSDPYIAYTTIERILEIDDKDALRIAFDFLQYTNQDHDLEDRIAERYTENFPFEAYSIHSNLRDSAIEQIKQLDTLEVDEGEVTFVEAYQTALSRDDTEPLILAALSKLEEYELFWEVHSAALEARDEQTLLYLIDILKDSEDQDSVEEALTIAYEIGEYSAIEEIEGRYEGLDEYRDIINGAYNIIAGIELLFDTQLPNKIVKGGPTGSMATIRYKAFSGGQDGIKPAA